MCTVNVTEGQTKITIFIETHQINKFNTTSIKWTSWMINRCILCGDIFTYEIEIANDDEYKVFCIHFTSKKRLDFNYFFIFQESL